MCSVFLLLIQTLYIGGGEGGGWRRVAGKRHESFAMGGYKTLETVLIFFVRSGTRCVGHESPENQTQKSFGLENSRSAHAYF